MSQARGAKGSVGSVSAGHFRRKYAESREMVFYGSKLAVIVPRVNSCRPRLEVGGVFVVGWFVSERLLVADPPGAEILGQRQGPSGNDMPLLSAALLLAPSNCLFPFPVLL
jgi:hypothetical protein